METRRDVFQAIADPTRRAILGLLTVKALTLNAVAENFNISRPAVSKHVKVLEECGLITIEQHGREKHGLEIDDYTRNRVRDAINRQAA